MRASLKLRLPILPKLVALLLRFFFTAEPTVYGDGGPAISVTGALPSLMDGSGFGLSVDWGMMFQGTGSRQVRCLCDIGRD